eukprot:tig00000350_g24333.t1
MSSGSAYASATADRSKAAPAAYAPTFEAEDSRATAAVKSRLPQPGPLPLAARGSPPPANAAHEEWLRLEERLSSYGLRERKIDGDGNCQFRAFSDSLYGTPSHHDNLRMLAVSHIRSNRALFEAFLPEPFEEYCTKMLKLGTWGDACTLKALSDYFGCEVNLITSYPTNWFLRVLPEAKKTNKEVWLCFHAEVHYQSLEIAFPIFSDR